MSRIFKSGDFCVINSDRDSIKEYNGIICEVLSYYPAETDERNISNLHDIIVISPAIPDAGQHTRGTLRLSPTELVLINPTGFILKLEGATTNIFPKDTIEILEETDLKSIALLSKYLDEEMMCGVARQVFQGKMSVLFDRICETRKSAGNTLYDEIMMRITDKELEKFAPELNGVFMKRVEQEILRTDHPEEGDQTFREWLRFALQQNAQQWIKDHKEEIDDLMQDSIQVAASHLCEDKLCEALGEQLGKILKEKF